MAPSAALRAVAHVLVRPEGVDVALDTPVYAKVLRRNKNAVSVAGLGDRRGEKCTLTHDQALGWAVSASEVDAFNDRALLRGAVLIQTHDQFLHGQVIECSDRLVQVKTTQGVVKVNPGGVTATAPIAALLLRNATFMTDE